MKSLLRTLSLIGMLTLFIFSVRGKGMPKVYDCFPFFNEVELLEIRLGELYDHVDKFVLVEWSQTHQGKTKPLYFEENKHLFEKFLDKIIHIKLEETIDTTDAWVRENFQRNALVRGLGECKDEDIILISDLDEIIRPKSIGKMVRILMRRKREYVSTTQKMYSFYLNRFRSLWHGTVGTTFASLKKRTPQYFRDRRNKGLQLDNAGWHFTYLGGLDRVIEKIEAFAHEEANTPEGKDNRRLLSEMENGQFEPLDSSFPRYVLEHESRLREIGFLR